MNGKTFILHPFVLCLASATERNLERGVQVARKFPLVRPLRLLEDIDELLLYKFVKRFFGAPLGTDCCEDGCPIRRLEAVGFSALEGGEPSIGFADFFLRKFAPGWVGS